MLQLRPMSVGDILDEAFHLYRNNFFRFLGITVLAQVPMALVSLVVNLVMVWLNPYAQANPWEVLLNPDAPYYYPSFAPQYPLGLNADDVFAITMLLSLLMFALGIAQSLVVNLIMIGALNRAISRRYHGRETSLVDAYNVGLRRYWRVLVATLLQGIGLFALGLVLGISLVIPCFGWVLALLLLVLVAFLSTRWGLLIPVAVLERAGPIEALRRSWRLTSGLVWRTFGVFLLSAILAWVLSTVPLYLVQVVLLPLYSVSALLVAAIQTVIASIGQILVYPVTIGILTLLYYDLRIRKEGYDVELLVRHVEETSRLAALPADPVSQVSS